MNELKKAMEDQRVNELWRVDVRSLVIDSIFRCEPIISARIEKVRGEKSRNAKRAEFEEDKTTYYSTDKVLVRVAIGKKWANFFCYDYDASLFINEVYRKVMFENSGIIEPLNFGLHEYMVFFDGIYYRGDTMNSWSTTVNEFFRRWNKWNGNEYLKGLQAAWW